MQFPWRECSHRKRKCQETCVASLCLQDIPNGRYFSFRVRKQPNFLASVVHTLYVDMYYTISLNSHEWNLPDRWRGTKQGMTFWLARAGFSCRWGTVQIAVGRWGLLPSHCCQTLSKPKFTHISALSQSTPSRKITRHSAFLFMFTSRPSIDFKQHTESQFLFFHPHLGL